MATIVRTWVYSMLACIGAVAVFASVLHALTGRFEHAWHNVTDVTAAFSVVFALVAAFVLVPSFLLLGHLPAVAAAALGLRLDSTGGLLMRKHLLGVFVFTCIVVSGVAVGRITAQSSRLPQNDDVLGALLIEVRGLRAAMEQMASAGPRAQLALARLQLQEQRINTMLRRIETIRDSLAKAQADVTNQQVEVARRETALRDVTLTADERSRAEEHLKMLRGHLAAPLAEVRRLTAEETSLAGEISAEQARWADFNQRLEDLERTLSRR
jgi:hypothetical protein